MDLLLLFFSLADMYILLETNSIIFDTQEEKIDK